MHNDSLHRSPQMDQSGPLKWNQLASEGLPNEVGHRLVVTIMLFETVTNVLQSFILSFETFLIALCL